MKEKVQAAIADIGLSMTVEFVPWSKSRNAKDTDPSLNWKVTILKGSRPILTTDYMAGCGHCPSYQQRATVDSAEAVKQECETGRAARIGYVFKGGKPILPDIADVLSSLLSDASTLDYGNFEEWANDTGSDPDSRKAEAIYRSCLEIGLKLRNGVGEPELSNLRTAFQDY